MPLNTLKLSITAVTCRLYLGSLMLILNCHNKVVSFAYIFMFSYIRATVAPTLALNIDCENHGELSRVTYINGTVHKVISQLLGQQVR